jgi:mRNA interferase MazF
MPSTTRFERGDLVLLAFPFSSGVGTKQRPALVLFDSGDQDILVARVTTGESRSPLDINLEDWKRAGLLAASSVRLHELATLEKGLVRRRLGRVSPSDWERIITSLRERVFAISG